MHFLHQLTEIQDIFYISERIKKINKNFKLYYNLKNNQYEVHNTSLKDSFVISYKNYPDQGLINKLHQTRKENISDLINFIEQQNQSLNISKENQLLDMAKQQLNEFVNFSSKNPSIEVTNKLLKNIIKKGE